MSEQNSRAQHLVGHGNTHFAFSDLNNRQIADQISEFLANHELD